MDDLVKISISNNIADVRLNRPEKYNALSPQMFEAILAAGQSISSNKSVRSVVLSGEGRGFCSGLDLETFKDIESKGIDLFGSTEKKNPNFAQSAAYVWKKLSVPVIAAMHGVAFGGGLQIALGADIRFASPDLRVSVMEIKWGLIPDMSGSQTLRDLVRLDIAKELVFSGRIVSAQEAERLGLITRICDDPLTEAFKLAKDIAKKSPDAIVAGKRLLEEAWHGNSTDGLMLEEELQKCLLGSPNQVKAIRANFKE